MQTRIRIRARTDEPVEPYPGPVDDPGEVERERPPPPRDPAEPGHIDAPEPVEPEPFEDPEPAGPGFDEPKPWDPRRPEPPDPAVH